MDKNLYLMRLERIQTWIAAGIVIALFAGVYLLGNLASPRLKAFGSPYAGPFGSDFSW